MSGLIWRGGALHDQPVDLPPGRPLRLLADHEEEDPPWSVYASLREVVYEPRRFTNGMTVYATPQAWAEQKDEITAAARRACDEAARNHENL